MRVIDKKIAMNRIGFHYFPDTDHYQQKDLENWAPKIVQLGGSWLVLKAPVSRALPESFITGLLNQGIEPIVHFDIFPEKIPAREEMALLFDVYARWGIKYVVFFDKPNLQTKWNAAIWAQHDLVERFLDLFIPLAQDCLKKRLTPVFPPLEPGGNYWDTAFLREALESMQRRGNQDILEKLILGANASAGDRPLDWGMGGPERWPGANPYFTPADEQDQCGFRIFDWYETISRSVLREALPVFLFDLSAKKGEGQTEKLLTMMRLLAGIKMDGLDPISNSVVGGAFRLVDSSQGWFTPEGNELPVTETVTKLQRQSLIETSPPKKEGPTIAHYLLLPSYEWGIPDYHLDAIRPFIKNHQPTVGFSVEEAAQAKRITVIGSEEDFPEKILRELRDRGCVVERIEADGTTLASQLDKLVVNT